MSESLPLKEAIFRNLSAELPSSAILASNTSSISITKIAAATIPDGQSASSKDGQKSASRVVGEGYVSLAADARKVFRLLDMPMVQTARRINCPESSVILIGAVV